MLPPEVVLTTQGGVLSLAGAITSEVAELEALLRAASANAGAAQRTLLLQAIAIGERGVFLEGSDDIESVDRRRAALEASLVAARLDAATTLIEESRLVEALETIDAALARNRLVERGWRLRMQALALLGDADGVVDALRACRAALAEVGLEPALATSELAARLRS